MANNIVAGFNLVTATANATWSEVGLNSTNTVEVYASNNGSPVSWRPNKTINTLNAGGIVVGKGYQINSKVARDLTAFFGIVSAGVVTLI